jgi:hypothetical protein
MKTIAGTFGELDRLPESDRHGKIIIDAIREGVAPFKPRHIYLFVENDIDYNRYAIFAEVWFNDGRWAWREFIDAWALAEDTDREAMKAAGEFFIAFRNRVAEPITDNIVLGEN